MDLISIVIGIGLVGALWRIATELSHLQTSVKYIVKELGELNEKMDAIEAISADHELRLRRMEDD